MALLDVIDNIKKHLSHTHKSQDNPEKWNLHNISNSGSWVGETVEKD